ncbi:F-box/FBD/LRR-repeat protein At1g13570 isoform X1 [Ziziphus jujuba]|uniref:F-box/FBD/LRR-repeat protein At1g13570 isoform X1 n=1 Tax=Ziziphus jujuba TaxID=326968 RepID=A0ABM4AI96_ZIZJJ|nr:F-box/FBD/LRR-repeat protein At1g13570 isoform X1 [Ziziphus jujuba]
MGTGVGSGNNTMLEKKDRISELPNEILVSILNRLSMEEATRTSVLSRRWKKLPTMSFIARHSLELVWNTSGTTGNWDFSGNTDKWDFVEWVDRILALRSSTTKKASVTLGDLAIRYDLNRSFQKYIDGWVSFACEKGVKRLELDFSGSTEKKGILVPYGFPQVEKICTMSKPCGSPTSFYSLKELRLIDLNVSGEVLEHFLSNSPFLERLFVDRSQSLVNLKVGSSSSSLNLKCLGIRLCYGMRSLKISAPNLVSFRYDGYMKYLFFENVPILSELSLGDIAPYFISYDANRLFGHLSQLRKLKLDMDLSVFSNVASNFYNEPQTFLKLNNLEQLEMVISSEHNLCLLWTCALVKAAPFLRRFAIEMTFETDDVWREDLCDHALTDLPAVPEDYEKELLKVIRCSHPFLEVVELTGFTGNPNTVELASHLLAIAISLKEIIIGTTKDEKARKSAERLRARISPGVNLVLL